MLRFADCGITDKGTAEVVESLIKTHGDEAAEMIIQHGDDAVKIISNYGDDGLTAIYVYGNEAIDVINNYADDAISAINNGIEPTLIKSLDDLGISPTKFADCGIVNKEAAEISESVIKNHGDNALKAITNHGENAITALKSQPARQADVVELINRADTICVYDSATDKYVNFIDLINSPDDVILEMDDLIAKRDLALADLDQMLPELTQLGDNDNLVVIGKSGYGGVSYKTVASKELKAIYFDPDTDDIPWSSLESIYGQLNIWEFNKEFLLRQVGANKDIILSHNPFDSNIRVGFYKMECDLLESLGYTFVADGKYWRAII